MFHYFHFQNSDSVKRVADLTAQVKDLEEQLTNARKDIERTTSLKLMDETEVITILNHHWNFNEQICVLFHHYLGNVI